MSRFGSDISQPKEVSRRSSRVEQFNGREGETATLLFNFSIKFHVDAGGFAPRHLGRSTLLVIKLSVKNTERKCLFIQLLVKMSLLINSYERDEKTNKIQLHEVEDHSLELGGFENCRKTFWGSHTSERFGLDLLCSLREYDLYAEGEYLLQLENEAKIILQFIDVFERETHFSKDFIYHRTSNILRAIAKAKEVHNGGVVIW